MSKYRKAVVATAGIFTVLGTVLADGSLSGGDQAALGAAVLTAIGVYFAPNKVDR